MSYNIKNDTAFINGQNGPYDNKVNNPDVRYGRNSVANYNAYLADLKPDRIPQDVLELSTKKDALEGADQLAKFLQNAQNAPLKFNMKYLPEDKVDFKNINKQALMGAAYEDLGGATKPVSELNKNIPQNADVSAFDINNDNQIDIGENAAAILVKDMADAHPTAEVLKTGKLSLDAADVDGSYTNTGETNYWSFLNKKGTEQSKQLITQIYNAFKLDKAAELFLKDKNNQIQ